MHNFNFFKKRILSAASILFLLLIINVFSINGAFAVEIIYPEYTGEDVVDLSQKFDSNYVSRLKGELNQAPNEIRIVFINTENKINLSFYAPKLFQKWQMSDDSILTVIDPYLNKTGYAFGRNIREDMKKRQEVKQKDDKSSDQDGNNIDYDNLVSAITDKFSPTEVKVKSEPKKDKSVQEIDSGISYKGSSDSNKKTKKSAKDDGKTKLIIFSLLGLALLAGGGWYYYNMRAEKKRKEELKNNYLFDADLLNEDISVLLGKIEADIEKMKYFDGTTLERVIPHINKLENAAAKAGVFLDKLNDNIQEVDIDELGYLRDVLDEGTVLKSELEEIHKESVAFRKEFKSIMKKSDMSMSDIRVNIENCKNTMEDIRTLYKLNLEHSEMMLTECQHLLSQSSNILRDNDPSGFKINLKNMQKIIKNLRNDLEVIPHLYTQIKENIPLNIERSLDNSPLEPLQKNKSKKEINDLREEALAYLSRGELEKSEKIIDSIYEHINEVRSGTKTT